MKKRTYFWIGFILLFLGFNSCSEGNTIGLSALPDNDKSQISMDTIRVQTETVFQDSLLLRNSTTVLGKFTDPSYGEIKSDFLSQLYCPYNFKFPNDVSTIDSGYIYFYYSSWFGDSTAPIHINVWELDKAPLLATASYNSAINPSDFCSMTKKIAEGSFSSADFYYSDSTKKLSNYQPVMRLPVTRELCDRILNDNRSNPEKFATPNAFKEYFKGIYVTSDYGDGCLFNLDHIELGFNYKTYLYSNESNKTLRDSLVVGGAYFPITKEVKQVNRVAHKDLGRLFGSISPQDSLNYIFAPSGMYTKVTIPDSVFEGEGPLANSTINALSLVIKATQISDNWNFKLPPPNALLLIDANRDKAFFENYSNSDGLYSFIANFDSKAENYVFNLSYYAQKMVRSKNGTSNTDFEPFTEMYLIPVTIVTNGDKDKVRTDNAISPSAMKIRSGNHPSDPMLLHIIYSKK